MKGGGGGGGAKYKKIFAQGKIKLKIHALQLTLKNNHDKAKKNSYKEFDNEKNSCGSKIPHHPHNFSNGPCPIRPLPCPCTID